MQDVTDTPKPARKRRRPARADGRGRLDYFTDTAGKPRWRLVSPNGEIIATSQPFESDGDCIGSIAALSDALAYEVRPAEALARASISPGLLRIALERFRHIQEKGFDKAHDAEHTLGELGRAAATYALPETDRVGDERGLPELWPWDERESFKPGDRIRELEKSGALIAAEIDRLLTIKE